MKIALFNVSGRLSSDGSRLISALLKRAGHRVTCVFLARPEPLEYGMDEFEPLDDILRQVGVVMIAVYSSYAVRAVQLTEFVRNKYPGMKVIWGGPHCVNEPDLGLRYADGVCFSEGDQVVVDLANKMEAGIDYLDTPNMAFDLNGTHIVNEVLPPFSDLDSLPYYDYDFDDQFLLDQGLFQMTKEKLKERLALYPYYRPILYVVTSRGCPHECTYCNNCRYVGMFGRNNMRFQSVDRIIQELEYALGHLEFIELVGFGDDDFFVRPKNQLEEFSEEYKKRVGLPFGVAVSANTFRKEKMEILIDAGLNAIQMGVQSGSQRTLDEVYNRKVRVSKTREVVHQIEPYHKKSGLDFFLDFIVDNPYETRDDIMQTYKYLLELPQHVRINLFFLSFFPGTPIYDKALKDGIIRPFDEKAFRFYTRTRVIYQKNYETFLVLLVRYLRGRLGVWRHISKSILRTLGSRPARGIASIFPESFYSLLTRFIQLTRGQ